MEKYILSLDIGTTTIRCFVYNTDAVVVGRCSCALKLIYPERQAVEIEPDSLWDQIIHVMTGSIENAKIKDTTAIASLGISTQRGTFLLWDKGTGLPFHNFLVWQDTRSDSLAKEWNQSYTMKVTRVATKGLHAVTQNKKYLAAAVLRFSAQQANMRLLWLLQKYPNLKKLATENKVCFGTLDTWIIWKLTKGKVFTTDYSCASATGLYDLYTMGWSGFFCSVLDIPMSIFPPVRDSSGDFGYCDKEFFGAEIPIGSSVGDQSAAMFGEGCFETGDVKLTIGTGAFLDLNTGSKPHTSVAGFYPQIGWKIGEEITYLAEGSSNTAGNAIDWLVNMKLIDTPESADEIARKSDSTKGVCFVPCFNGLQAPINDYNTCCSIMGVTADTKPEDIVRAVLESLAFRNLQLFQTMLDETDLPMKRFVCDGGVTNSDLIMQLSADMIGKSITKNKNSEMSALGAAFLAGLSVKYWSDKRELIKLLTAEKVFKPSIENQKKYKAIMQVWLKALRRSGKWY